MNDIKVKKQIIDKIKDSTNVLVALNSSPTVDELSAALGVTLAINKIDKHATAVFSGDIPAAIAFLEPEKTFENDVTSLQDFIIALDKEKADHLRYKVDGDVVKIFITPYRTTITESDLEFSQGDYNVDFVLAIGVKSEADLDAALSSHGKILEDATVASISLDEASNLGSINWNDQNASSYCEIVTGFIKDLKDDVLDEQIATALLTGIVAATDRFSNNKTSSRVMTTAADLMGAGANQQLIAVQLEKADAISTPAARQPEAPAAAEAAPEAPVKQAGGAGELSISHELKGTVDQVAEQVAQAQQTAAAKEAEVELSKQLQGPQNPVVAQLTQPQPVTQVASVKAGDYEEAPLPGAAQNTPSFGGTLNATTEEAADEKRREQENEQNHTILSHDSGHYLGGQPSYQAPISAALDTAGGEPEVRDIFADSPQVGIAAGPASHGGLPALEPAPEPVHVFQPAVAPAPTPSTLPPLPSIQPSTALPPVADPTVPTLAEIDAANRAHTDALSDVHAAFTNQPPQVNPAAGAGLPPLPPLPPMPDFSTLPPLPGVGEDPFGGQSTIPPQPLGGTLPPAPVVADPAKADPGQFKIPGQ